MGDGRLDDSDETPVPTVQVRVEQPDGAKSDATAATGSP
jgi:hypothetical protein